MRSFKWRERGIARDVPGWLVGPVNHCTEVARMLDFPSWKTAHRVGSGGGGFFCQSRRRVPPGISAYMASSQRP